MFLLISFFLFFFLFLSRTCEDKIFFRVLTCFFCLLKLFKIFKPFEKNSAQRRSRAFNRKSMFCIWFVLCEFFAGESVVCKKACEIGGVEGCRVEAYSCATRGK